MDAAEGAVRPGAGLLRPKPGAGGPDGVAWTTCSRVGLFLRGSREGLVRALDTRVVVVPRERESVGRAAPIALL